MSSAAFDVLRKVTTATITTMLLKKGIRRCWMNGPKPLTPGGERLIGPAFTLRFVPVREDLATPESWGKPISTRAAIEDMPEGCMPHGVGDRDAAFRHVRDRGHAGRLHRGRRRHGAQDRRHLRRHPGDADGATRRHR